MILNRGTQIIYVPEHITFNGEFSVLSGGQPGFVVAGPIVLEEGGDQMYYCRYWQIVSGVPTPDLRTQSNSELTPVRLCLVKDSVPQEWVNEWLHAYLKGGRL